LRILNYHIFYLDILLIFFMLLICAINIIIHSKFKHSISTVFFYISSLFGLISLFCLFADLVIIDLSLDSIYKLLTKVFAFLCVLCVFIWIIIFFVSFYRKKKHFSLPPNLEEVFNCADDLLIVSDYKGNIIKVNNNIELFRICGKVETINDIFNFINTNLLTDGEKPEYIDDLGVHKEYEFYSVNKDFYLKLVVSPLFSGKEIIGFLVIFHDITLIRKSELILEEQNQYLSQANEKLRKYIQIAGALEAERTRLQIYSDIQCSLIEKTEKAKELIDEIKTVDSDSEKYRNGIKSIAEFLRNIYKDVRYSINSIVGKDFQND